MIWKVKFDDRARKELRKLDQAELSPISFIICENGLQQKMILDVFEIIFEKIYLVFGNIELVHIGLFVIFKRMLLLFVSFAQVTEKMYMNKTSLNPCGRGCFSHAAAQLYPPWFLPGYYGGSRSC